MTRKAKVDFAPTDWAHPKSLHSRDHRVRQIVEAFNSGERQPLAILRHVPGKEASRQAAVQAIARAHQIAGAVVALRGSVGRPAKTVSQALYLLQRIEELRGLPEALDILTVRFSMVKAPQTDGVLGVMSDLRASLSRLFSNPALPFVAALSRELANRHSAKQPRGKGRPADIYRRAFIMVLVMQFVKETKKLPPLDAHPHTQSRRGSAIFYDIASAALQDIGEELSPRASIAAVRGAILALDDDEAVAEIQAVRSILYPKKSRKSRIALN